MATPDKNRKSTRHFNLEKRGGRSFDLEKEAVAPIVTPKPTPTPQQPAAPVVPDNSGETAKEGGGSNKWMWVVGVILVVAIIAWLCVRSCSSSNDNGAATGPTVETVDATEASEEEAVIEEPSTEGETEQPVSSGSGAQETAVTSEAQEGAASEAATPPATQAASETPNRSTAASATTSAPVAEVSSDIEAEAMKVIRGEYGTGLERKLKLGSKYREIQNRVNELKRQGAF